MANSCWPSSRPRDSSTDTSLRWSTVSRGARASRAFPALWRTVTRSLTFTRFDRWVAMCSTGPSSRAA